MANRPKSVGDKNLIAAIDLGGAKTSCMIGEAVALGGGRADIDVLGVGQHGGLTREVKSDLEASLRAAIEAAERMAGERIRAAYATAPGRVIACRRIGVDLDLAGGRVTRDDVADCLAEAQRLAAPEGARSIGASPIRFRVDGEHVDGSPIGAAGASLFAEVLALSVRDSHRVNIETLFWRCGIDLQGFIAAPVAASEAVLIEDEKDLGVILLDIGARTTDFAAYDRGVLVACGGVGLGGDNITRDIAQIFSAPLGSAERVKTLHGSALAGSGDEHRFVEFPQLGDARETLRVSRAEVAAVIAPRLEEILELALAGLEKSGAPTRGMRRAVLTGGGSLLVGAREMTERVMGVKARLGRAAGLLGAPDAATAPQFAAVAGALRCAARQATQPRTPFARAWSLAGSSLRSEPSKDGASGAARPGRAIGGVLRGVSGWLRQNF